MNIFHRKSLLAACIAAMMGLHGYAQKNEASPRLSDYFSPATTNTMSPDSEGFIQRWLLLEPIDKPNRSNTVFTDSYIREAFATEYFPNQFTVLPKDGDKVKVGKQKLTWHALDSKLFNVKLFRFASGLKKQCTACCSGQSRHRMSRRHGEHPDVSRFQLRIHVVAER